MVSTNILYDIILTGIIAAFYLALYGAAAAIIRHRRKTKPSKGNPFRRFSDHQVRSILTKQK